MSNDKNSLFTNQEIIALYKIVREHQEELPATETEIHFDYYDDYEELVGKNVLRAILKKLSKKLPKEEKDSLDKEFLRKKYSSFNNEIDERVYSVLERAFSHLKTVEISYFNIENAEFSKRKIDIYYKSRRYIIGYCHLRKSIRKFRTSRIASAKLTKNKYQIREDFNKNNY